MLDISFVREKPKIVKEDLKKRGMNEKVKDVDRLIDLYEKHIQLKSKLDSMRHERNKISEEINKLRKEGKDIKDVVNKAKELPGKIKKFEEKNISYTKEIRKILMSIPNVLHKTVPVGKDADDNKVVKTVGDKTKLSFEQKPHGEFLEANGLADFKRAAKISGAGFYFLKGDIAILDLALQRYAIDTLVKKGFTFTIPPFMMNRKSYEGVTDLDDFENVMYKIEDEDLYMIATSEHPLTAQFSGELIEEEDLPLKLCGLSPCFRKEIGSRGVDTKGLFRVHQFHKVEQVVIATPEQSWKLHEEMQAISEKLFKDMKIPYRVVNCCTGDMGVVAAKKYDIEGWFPRENTYRELTSASNCTSFQAVRLNIKYKTKKGEKAYVYTLNNTGIAIPRTLRAIVENFQTEDGKIKVPRVLWPYMNGVKTIGGKQNGR